uniref:BHLH domain-containing protein n=1 Tax=Dracunculus medinensis TaxID=318479 RepID=A0A0N4U282_DRAME
LWRWALVDRNGRGLSNPTFKPGHIPQSLKSMGVGFGVKENSIKKMVRSESVDEDLILNCEKVSGIEDDDEYGQWTYSNRSATSGRVNEDTASQNGVVLSDRRIRRQIANCNERRRMQSINAGFQKLLEILKNICCNAAILQQTAELIHTLQADNLKLIEEKEAVIQSKKRKLQEEKRRENILVDELTLALEKERSLRQFCEQQLRELQAASPLISPISLSVTPQLHLGASIINSPAVGSHTTIAGLLPPSLEEIIASSPYTSQNSKAPRSSSVSPISPTLNMVKREIEQDTTANRIEILPQPQPLRTSTDRSPSATSAANISQRNLNAILEAIRHLEGGTVMVPSSTVSPNQHSNVLVR